MCAPPVYLPQEEFCTVYCQTFGLDLDDSKDTWKKMDKDGDGNLTVDELAEFYGFKTGEGEETAVDMTDDQITEALKLMSALQKMESDKAAAFDKAKAAEAEKKKEAEGDDGKKSTLKRVKMDDRKEEDKMQIEFLEACALGDIKEDKDENGVTVESCIKEKIDMRVEDEKGETALHKLARYKVEGRSEDAKRSYVTAIKNICRIMKEQGAEKGAGGKESSRLGRDVNHQDKAGKTPLYLAVEHKNVTMMDELYELGARDGPDTLLVNANGWSIMHAAVSADDVEVLKHLLRKFSPARIESLLVKTDLTGRAPLHIAAYKCSEEMVSYLLSIGAKNEIKDIAGNLPSTLAEKGGRKKSKEIIETPIER